MNSYQLRINYNHLKHQINHDYLSVRDYLTRCFISNLVIINNSLKPVESLTMEESLYNQLLKGVIHFSDAKQVFRVLNLVDAIPDALDMLPCVEEFICKKHIPTKVSYVQTTIDSGYHFVVNLKII